MRLRHVAEVDPAVPALSRAGAGREVSFLPLERVWPDERFDASQTVTFTGETGSYNAVQEGDILVPKVSPTFSHGRVAIAKGLTGGAALATSEVFVVRAEDPRNTAFLRYRLLAADFRSEGAASQTGVAGLKRVSADFLRNVPLEPRAWEARHAIAAHLDLVTARIGAAIAKKQAILTALDEFERSALDEAFSDESYRPTRLGYLLEARPCYGVLVPKFVEADGVRFIRVNDLAELDSRADNLVQIEQAQATEFRRTQVRAGDVLVSVVGSIDRAAVVPPELEGANIARAVARLQPQPHVPPVVLRDWVRTPDYQRQAVLATSADTAQPTLNMGDLVQFSIRLPPTAGGLLELERRLNASAEQVANVRTPLLEQVKLLREYRDAVITEAVTGNIDVADLEADSDDVGPARASEHVGALT